MIRVELIRFVILDVFKLKPPCFDLSKINIFVQDGHRAFMSYFSYTRNGLWLWGGRMGLNELYKSNMAARSLLDHIFQVDRLARYLAPFSKDCEMMTDRPAGQLDCSSTSVWARQRRLEWIFLRSNQESIQAIILKKWKKYFSSIVIAKIDWQDSIDQCKLH